MRGACVTDDGASAAASVGTQRLRACATLVLLNEDGANTAPDRANTAPDRGVAALRAVVHALEP